MRYGIALGIALALSAPALAAEDRVEGQPLNPTKHNAGASHELPLEDIGAELGLDPYVNDSGLVQGELERFRRVYVDPNAFPGTLTPKAPPAVALPESVGGFADGGNGAGQVVKFDMNRRFYPENIVAIASVSKAITDAGLGTVEADGADSLRITLGDKGAAPLYGLLFGPVKGEWRRVSDLGDLFAKGPEAPAPAPVEPAPAPAKGKAAPAPVEAPAPVPAEPAWVALTTSPATLAGVPAKGVLPVSNRRSSWAEVSINGTKVGIVGPYTDAFIHGVAAGSYDLTLRVGNGYTWTQAVVTTPERAEWPLVDAGMSQRQQ